jgi:DNA transformation protein and related proteins
MVRNNQYLDYVKELLVDIKNITYRPMFGGWGIYKNNIIIGIIAFNTIYLKINQNLKTKYLELGSQPFSYEKNNKIVQLTSYYELPIAIQEDNQMLQIWIDEVYQYAIPK